MNRRAYAAVSVNVVDVKNLHEQHVQQDVLVGFDVGKYEVLSVCHWSDGSFERPWRVLSPTEIPQLTTMLQQLQVGRKLVVAMESSGTYGDPLRYAMHRAGIEVRRVSSKASHDYAEIFDGVPSQHDGKDAAVVAELASMGKAVTWTFKEASAWEEELQYWVEHLEMNRKIEQLLVSSLEGLLARHWPEVTRVLALSSGTLVRLLAHYGAAAAVAGDEGALARVTR